MDGTLAAARGGEPLVSTDDRGLLGDVVEADAGRHDRPRLSTALAALLLLAAYGALSLLNDPSAYLGTDTGGKVLTLDAMVESGSHVNLDIGYWAEQWDPDGDLHPYFGTAKIGDRWIQVTSVPMILAARPLYALGGYRAALLIPMVGGVVAALAAQALAQTVGAGNRSARRAFWLVGLAGPLTIYSLDLWEHSLGVAAMAWATVLLLRARDRAGVGAWAPMGFAAGLLWGLAFSMRTESLVYGAVITGAILGWMVWTDRGVVRGVSIGAFTAAGLGVMVPLMGLLERWAMGGSFRLDRAAGAASSGGDGWAVRLEEGIITTFGFSGDETGVFLGAVAVLGLAAVAWIGSSGREPSERLPLLVIAACAPFVVLVLMGLGFVPGFMVAAPLCVLGLVAKGDSTTSPLRWGAVTVLPVVWAFQYVGGAGPQWGGRYVLMSAFLLTVLGAIALAETNRLTTTVFVGLAIAVTAFGMAWMVVRTHSFADAGRSLAARDDQVLVASRSAGFLPREFVADNGDRRWLSVTSEDELDRAAMIVGASGADQFGVMWIGEAPSLELLGDFELTGVDRIPLVSGTFVEIANYELR